MTYAHWRGTAASLAAIGCALVLQACGGGGGGSPSARGGEDVGLNPAVPTSVTQVTPTGIPATVDSGVQAVVQVTGSPAQVTLPAHAFVAYDNASQAITGQVDVVITPIAPSVNPLAMAGGSYAARVPGSDQTQLIESFGAITVDLSQGGQRVQLAPGKKATIRIPLDTRSTERPATMPLYYWDETDRVWIQEGMATLKTDAATGKSYYEGQVSHFSTWNADRPIEESATVQGCLRDEQGNKVSGLQYQLMSDGVDYSGLALGSLLSGDFTVVMKKGGHANLLLLDQSGQMPNQQWDLGTVNGDMMLSTCLVVKAKFTPEATAADAFFQLLRVVDEAFNLSQAVASAIDIDLGIVHPAAQVCAGGSLSQLQLDGNTVSEAVILSPGPNYTLNTTFAACNPWDVAGETDGAITTQVLTGGSTASFNYTQPKQPGPINGTLTATLKQLNDSSVQLTGQGPFVIGLSQVIGSKSATSAMSWAPQPGATMAHTTAGVTRTATFKGGSLTVSTTNTFTSTVPQATKSYSALTYTLGGATYVLQGSLTEGIGQVSLSKNGSVISTLTTTADSATATGLVDPF
jgi:hypothetical protein